jgi:uncharacterized protein
MTQSCSVKLKLLKNQLAPLEKILVAFSGGVDSTFLLKVAVDTLGRENVLACIAISPSLSKFQHSQALKNAKLIGARILETPIDELSDTNYAANKADRCFHCKSHLCRELLDIASQKGLKHVVFGTNCDDLDDFRPGSRAMKVFGVRSPLAEAGLTKQDIRTLSKKLSLETADVPASPCLASRIAYGLEITQERLKQIERAEEYLRSLGFVEFRVRHHNKIARIEVHPEDFDKITAEPNRSRIIKKLKSLGFRYITIDLQGFRSGSLNEVLTEAERRKNT